MSVARDIEVAAATWLLRREEAGWTPADEALFQRWLAQSYAHKAAFWRLESGWDAADRIRALGSPDGAAVPVRRPRQARWLALAASLAALVVAVPVSLRLAGPEPQPASSLFETPVGGHRQLALPDGSRVELNTATVIRASVSGSRRDVWLDKGEAFFSVAHTGAPFLVHAGPRLVTVLGTKFSVWREGESVRVAVVEGKVAVSDTDGSKTAASATITRGDMIEAEGNSTLVLQGAERQVERSLSWREGMLQFDRTPLIRAAQEFNRYNARKLTVTGEAATIPISGRFKATNGEAFARLLHDAYGLKIDEKAAETTISG